MTTDLEKLDDLFEGRTATVEVPVGEVATTIRKALTAATAEGTEPDQARAIALRVARLVKAADGGLDLDSDAGIVLEAEMYETVKADGAGVEEPAPVSLSVETLRKGLQPEVEEAAAAEAVAKAERFPVDLNRDTPDQLDNWGADPAFSG